MQAQDTDEQSIQLLKRIHILLERATVQQRRFVRVGDTVLELSSVRAVFIEGDNFAVCVKDSDNIYIPKQSVANYPPPPVPDAYKTEAEGA